MTGAVVLAGGYGTRMWPLSERRPKHLLPVGNEPVIAHQLRWLAAAGIHEVVLATAYQADAFRPVLGDGATYGVHLHYVRESTPRGTAGALRNALSAMYGPRLAETEEAVVVLNGDLMTQHDLRAQLEVHRRRAAAATIHVRRVDDARPYGLVEMDGEKITRFREKPARLLAGSVNAGTYVLAPRTLANVPTETPCSLEREIFPSLAQDCQMWGYREEAPFADIGTPASLLTANLTWAQQRRQRSVVLSDRVSTSATIRESLVMPDAQIAHDVVLERCLVAPGAVIGAGAQLVDCVLGDDAWVGAGRHLTGQTLAVGERR